MNTAPKNEPKGNKIITKGLYWITLYIRKISDNKLIVGGAEMLEAQRRNIRRLKEGKSIIIPLFKKILRLEKRS